jgi:hypothetical protein
VSENTLPPALIQPSSVDSIDLSMAFLEETLLRRASAVDRTTIANISRDLCLHPGLVTTVFANLRERQMFDVTHLEGMGNYHFTLTDAGRERARSAIDRCGYVGPAPVSLKRYEEVVGWLKSDVEVSDEQLRARFSDLVLNPEIVDELGAAFAGQRSILLWGPAGTGKTSLAERLIRLYEDWILVPHAIEVDGNIITVYDPSVHTKVDTVIEGIDERWVICERPLVVGGGELELSMLQLQRDPITKIYSARCS